MTSYFILKKHKDLLDTIKVCSYCGDSNANTIDHIHPRIKGGGRELTNLTKACSKCNSYKTHFDIDVFLKRMIQKREDCFQKFMTYSGRYRRYKSRNNSHPDLEWLKAKMSILRPEHSYFTKVIRSLIDKKYIIFN